VIFDIEKEGKEKEKSKEGEKDKERGYLMDLFNK